MSLIDRIDSRISYLLATSIICVSVIGIGYNHYQQRKIDRETQKIERQVYKERVKITDLSSKTQVKLVKQGLSSNDIQTRQSAEQVSASSKLNRASSELFSTLVTYNSQESWLKRKQVAAKLVTPEILKDKKLFNDGKDTTGNSFIDTYGLNSEFVRANTDAGLKHDNIIDGIVHVTYKANQRDTKPATRIDVYQVTYDLGQQKFTQVHKLGSEALDTNE